MSRIRANSVKVGMVPVDACGIREALMMMTMPAMAADALGKHLAEDFRRLFGSSHEDKAERLDSAARIALECLSKSDALYHNVEHTFLVTLVGRDILHGRMLTERLEPDDYSHLIVACLLHDIGYVRGILKGDGDGSVRRGRERADRHPGARGIGCGPRALSRRPLQALRHGAPRAFATLDTERVAQAIEFTRFPTGQTARTCLKTGRGGWSRPRT